MSTPLFPFALDETLAAVQAMATALGRELGTTSLARDDAGDLSERDEAVLRDAGMFSLLTPEAHGGAGLGLDALVVALEALASHDPSVAMVVWAQNVCGAHVHDERVALAWGEGCFVGGRDAAPLDAAARPLDLSLDPSPSLGFRGAGWRRVSRARASKSPATTAAEGGPLPLDAVAGLLAIASGIARGAHEAALAYAVERKQFKRAIAEFQAIQWMLADGATTADALCLLARDAATRAAALEVDQADGSAVPGEAYRAALHRAGHELRFAARRCQSVADSAVQIHGGAGYTTEYPVGRLLRDASALMRVPRVQV